MIKAEQAFQATRTYLAGDPVYANYNSVKPLLILPNPDGSWLVVCEYATITNQQKQRALILVNANGEINGLANLP